MDYLDPAFKLEFWKLSDELTVVQAALLIIYEDPAEHQEYVLENQAGSRPEGFDAVFSALKNTINSGNLRALIRHDVEPLYGLDPSINYERQLMKGTDFGNVMIEPAPNWQMTTIDVEDLKKWLADRGYKRGFFFEEESTEPDYLDKSSDFYAPKLAAAINAWLGVTTDDKYNNNGKTVKQNLENWLTSHASEFGLLKNDGDINTEAIEKQISKVANWAETGGAPKTPGS